MIGTIMKIHREIVIILFLITVASCRENYTPKPPGYLRIDFPEKKYRLYDSFPAFRFEYPDYALISSDSSLNVQPGWLNIHFPSLNGTLYLSYKKINNNLDYYISDSRSLAYKHTIKAQSIDEILIRRPEMRVFGIFYDIKGNVASSIQFFATDSTNHFLRGSLYFNAQPNQDSLAPVIGFLRKDVDYFLNTLEWKY
jgi:gliding motility-associated lipoprotein GldD